ncbi:hypothetical protein ACFY1B_31665 [Streptomyces mirabilis]|uniref:hypothetical protein n=1 Tax=Streptomyces mirabilis TaxID=68239 RepID=UPI0036805766
MPEGPERQGLRRSPRRRTRRPLHRDSPEHAEALAVTGAHLFDRMGGRPMKDWACLPLAASARRLTLAEAAREQPR